MSPRRPLVALCWLVGASLLACGGRRATPAPPPSASVATPVPTPADDGSGTCADVGALRACWDGAGVARLAARPVPAAAPSSSMGWRCAWPGRVRLCADRRAAAPPFACEGARCTQRHARRPDDGEWTCADSAGAVVCVGGERAAGVVAGPPDPAWICGTRRAAGAPDPFGSRLCVDLSPDFPDGDMTAWRCRSEGGPANARVCERAPGAAVLTASCDRGRPCVDGAACVGARCLPARPAPSCWLDADCPGGACRFGTCREEGAP